MALKDSLISHWKLEEASGTRVDAHGNNDLTDNQTVGQAAGKIGSGADFEESVGGASTDFKDGETLSITDANQIGLALSGDFTFSFWLNLEQLPSTLGDVMGLISKYTGTSDQRSYTLQISNADIFKLFVSDDGTSTNLFEWDTDNAAVGAGDVGNFVHFFVTCDISTNEVKIYKNNSELAATKALDNGTVTEIFDSSTPFILGKDQSDVGNNFLDGVLDEVSVWNRIITQSERGEIYNNGDGLAFVGWDAVGPANLKTLNGVAAENIKTINGRNIEDIKSINGIS